MGEKELNTVYIYTGGGADARLLPKLPEAAFVIAADSGYRLALSCGVVPNLLLGDMDSLGECDIEPSVSVIRVKAEKNETDTMLAIDYALEHGAEEIFIFGGLGGRVDHGISNLFMLEYIANRGANGILSDGQNRVRYIKNQKIDLPCGDYKYFSLLCVDRTAEGVSISNCKYPLCGAVLERERQYAVSNEFIGVPAEIEVKRGALFIVESNN